MYKASGSAIKSNLIEIWKLVKWYREKDFDGLLELKGGAAGDLLQSLNIYNWVKWPRNTVPKQSEWVERKNEDKGGPEK